MATAAAELRSLGPNSNLDVFDADYLQTDESYRDSCNAVIDRLVKFLQNNVPISVKEVVKGGSLAKGTALKGKSDIDLVIFLSKYHNVESVVRDMDELLRTLEKYLGEYGECKITGRTKFAVQVEVACHAHHEHSVDLLPACDVLGDLKPAKVYDQMKMSKDRHYFSASLVKLQLAFVRELPAKVKSLIRIIKHWRKSVLPYDSRRWPTSYILELITIKKWNDAHSPDEFPLKRGFHSVLRALGNYRKFKVMWCDNYGPSYEKHTPPYVIDPANPFNNVMDRCDVWEDVATFARKSLGWKIFFGIRKLENWKNRNIWN